MKRQVVCILLLATVVHYAIAVINSSTTKATDEASVSSSVTNNQISDSIAASSEQNNRREANDLSKNKVIEETYLILPNNNHNIPASVYGTPAAATYPGPPPDIPPPVTPLSFGNPPSGSYGAPPISHFKLPQIQQDYGPPVQQVFLALPQKSYGPPKTSKPFNIFIKTPSAQSHGANGHVYGVPQNQPLNRPFPQKSVVSSFKFPKPHYGPPLKFAKGPAPTFNIQQRPFYDLPKLHDPVKTYGPPASYINLATSFTPPIKNAYGAPTKNVHSSSNNHHHYKYQVQQALNNAQTGVSAPPTPPDIKYDGWKPIPGLISKLPNTYGAPHAQQTNQNNAHHSHDLNYNTDFIPPPLEISKNVNSGQAFSDSYTAPLNSVTGAGGVVSSSGLALKPEHDDDDVTLSLGLSSLGIQGNKNTLSVIKSVDYDLSQYGNSQNNHVAGSHSSVTGVLIPPSGVYGVPSNSQYGTPLLNSPKKHTLFKDTIPAGLIHSIGRNIGNHRGYQGHGNQHSAPSYIKTTVQHDYIQPPALSILPLENQPMGNNIPPTGLIDSYGVPKFSALTSSYDNIPVSVDLTQSLPGNIPVSYKGANYLSNQNWDQSGAHVSVGLPLTKETTYNSNEIVTDLEVALSQKSKAISLEKKKNTREESKHQTDEDSHAISIAQSLDPNSELIKSRDIDFNNIPLKGSQGTYTLSIQSSDGSGSLKSLPHNQILNEGILQSILNAIEQPQYNGIGELRQSFPKTEMSFRGANEISNNFKLPEVGKLSHFKDSDSQDSVKAHVILEASATNGTLDTSFEQPQTTSATPLKFLDSNEIAFYFRNNAEKQADVPNDNDDSDVNQNKRNELNLNENKNQYESYVSFKTSNSNISYGNSPPSNVTVLNNINNNRN